MEKRWFSAATIFVLWSSATTLVTEGRGVGLAFESRPRNPNWPGLAGSCRQLISIWACWITAQYSLVGAVLCMDSNHVFSCALQLGPTQPITDFWMMTIPSNRIFSVDNAKRSRMSDDPPDDRRAVRRWRRRRRRRTTTWFDQTIQIGI